MLTQNDLKTNNEYLNKCIINSLCLIDNISLSDIFLFSDICKKYQAELLSGISLYNNYLYFALNNFANIQKDIYFDSIIKDFVNIKNLTFNSLQINDLQKIISSMVSELTAVKTNIEKYYRLDSNSLSLYNLSDTEEGLNYTDLKDKSAVVFKYCEGKNTLKKIISFMDNFTKTKKDVDDFELSSDFSILEKFNITINNVILNLQNQITFVNNTEEMIDSCFISEKIYDTYNFSNTQTIDSFLNRKYSKIKEDVITLLYNYL